MKKILFNTLYPSGNYTKNLEELFSNYDLFRQKYFSNLCLNKLRKKYSNTDLFLTHSATGALEMIAMLLDLKADDEIIVPSFTFVSTANAFAKENAKLVFVDIEENSLGLDPLLVEKAITSKTKAIVCMHYAGHTCQIEKLKEIAKKHQVVLIEDAALCYGKNELGASSDFGVVSFDVTKHISATQGGLLIVNNEKYIERAHQIYHAGTNRESFNKGNTPYYEWVSLGSKFQMPETNAAIFAAQLAHEDKIFQKLRQISQWYFEELNLFAKKSKLFCIMDEEKMASNYHEFYLICAEREIRNNIMSGLKEKSIEAFFHYIPLHDSQFAKNQYPFVSEKDVTSYISSRLLRLPFHTQLGYDDVKLICDSIKEILRR